MSQIDQTYIYLLERGKAFNWSSIIGIWGIFREKGSTFRETNISSV
jgi:hypothetical protein